MGALACRSYPGAVPFIEQQLFVVLWQRDLQHILGFKTYAVIQDL